MRIPRRLEPRARNHSPAERRGLPTARHAFALAAALAASITTGRAEPGSAIPSLPCRQPQLAAAGSTVYLTCGEGSTVFVSTSRDGGGTFGPLHEVLHAPSLALGNHRGPRIAAAGNALVISAVVATRGGGKDGNLVAVRSTDGGRTWSAPTRINDAPDAAREGLHAMTASGSQVVTAWLDLRATGTRLYAATSTDAGRSWSPNVLAYESPSGSICQCCHPSLALGADGTILLMFRNAIAGHRDLYLVRSVNGKFGPAEKLGDGTWPLDACPMDGGGIAVEPDGGVATVWRRQGTVYLARPGEPEVKVADGANPAIATAPGGPAIAWTGAEGLVLATPDRPPLMLDAAGRFPSLARAAGVTVVAWEHGTGTHTRTVE